MEREKRLKLPGTYVCCVLTKPANIYSACRTCCIWVEELVASLDLASPVAVVLQSPFELGDLTFEALWLFRGT